ncbi:MAG: PIN domain-containing protein [bacterium]
MRVYLDNCCLNRPFDGQDQTRITLETEAKLDIQGQILAGKLELAWSYILDYENHANPFEERRAAIRQWRSRAVVDVVENATVLAKAAQLVAAGLASKDALHVACAEFTKCDVFLTTDDDLLKKANKIEGVKVLNPTSFVIGGSK